MPTARRPVGPPRAESREVSELKQLKARLPELAVAVDLELELLQSTRRIQARVPLPAALLSRGRIEVPATGAILRFSEIPLDWSDFRLVLRETADILKRFEVVEPAIHLRLLQISRQAGALEPLVERFYTQTSAGEELTEPILVDSAQILTLALRPFLSRAADALFRQMEFTTLLRRTCPLCGAEPDFAVIMPSGERRLVCSRCRGRWPSDPLACPFCGNDDRRTLVSLGSSDGHYRVEACDACLRYVKAHDERASGRPTLVPVDAVATLSLDAAAIQRGYR